MNTLAGQIWQKLASIDLSSQTDKKGKLTYLSWAWAWGSLMNHYPNTVYEFSDRTFPDGSMEVTCQVTITESDQSVTRSMWLAVMDNRNGSIQNPNSTDINKSKMRCLTKCLGMFGLGHYIYAGEDVPEDSSVSDEERQAELIKLMSGASQVAKLKAVITQQSKWVKSMETKNPEIFHKVHEVYSLKTQQLSEGKIANGK